MENGREAGAAVALTPTLASTEAAVLNEATDRALGDHAARHGRGCSSGGSVRCHPPRRRGPGGHDLSRVRYGMSNMRIRRKKLRRAIEGLGRIVRTNGAVARAAARLTLWPGNGQIDFTTTCACSAAIACASDGVLGRPASSSGPRAPPCWRTCGPPTPGPRWSGPGHHAAWHGRGRGALGGVRCRTAGRGGGHRARAGGKDDRGRAYRGSRRREAGGAERSPSARGGRDRDRKAQATIAPRRPIARGPRARRAPVDTGSSPGTRDRRTRTPRRAPHATDRSRGREHRLHRRARGRGRRRADGRHRGPGTRTPAASARRSHAVGSRALPDPRARPRRGGRPRLWGLGCGKSGRWSSRYPAHIPGRIHAGPGGRRGGQRSAASASTKSAISAAGAQRSSKLMRGNTATSSPWRPAMSKRDGNAATISAGGLGGSRSPPDDDGGLSADEQTTMAQHTR